MPGDRASIFGFYYNRRGKDHDADVLFPLFWRLRDFNTTSTVVFPFFHREREATKEEPARHDNWVPPVVFEGASADGSGYFHVPPLLTYTDHNRKGGLNIAGPMFCKWKGGPACDPRTADQLDMGLPPLYFYGKTETSEYEVIPPLLHYYVTTRSATSRPTSGARCCSSTHRTRRWSTCSPSSTGAGERTSRTPRSSRSSTTATRATPACSSPRSSLSAKGEDGSTTVASWVYAKYRGRTELDMYTPFYWQYRDPDIGLDRKMLLPFFYQSSSPRSKDTVVFPFYARFQREGISDQIWVTPLFRHVGDVNGLGDGPVPALLVRPQERDVAHRGGAPLLGLRLSPLAHDRRGAASSSASRTTSR